MYIGGALIVLPFLVFVGGVYRVFLLDRAVQLNHVGIILLIAIVVSLPLHELLHGIGWKLAGRLENYEIRFRFCHGMPACVCQTILTTKDYLFGLTLPFFVLGGGSMVFLLFYPGTISMITVFVNLLLPGADLLVSCKILRSGAAKIAYVPEQKGFTGLYLSVK